jgi:hypothetical protein
MLKENTIQRTKKRKSCIADPVLTKPQESPAGAQISEQLPM